MFFFVEKRFHKTPLLWELNICYVLITTLSDSWIWKGQIVFFKWNIITLIVMYK